MLTGLINVGKIHFLNRWSYDWSETVVAYSSLKRICFTTNMLHSDNRLVLGKPIYLGRQMCLRFFFHLCHILSFQLQLDGSSSSPSDSLSCAVIQSSTHAINSPCQIVMVVQPLISRCWSSSDFSCLAPMDIRWLLHVQRLKTFVSIAGWSKIGSPCTFCSAAQPVVSVLLLNLNVPCGVRDLQLLDRSEK